jgi:ankyrin repeat protein
MSPLMKAAAVGFIEAMELLIDMEHDVNYATANGECALRVACIGAKPRAVQLLLEAGANPNATDSLGVFFRLINREFIGPRCRPV